VRGIKGAFFLVRPSHFFKLAMQSLNQFLNHSLGRVKEAIHTGSSKDSLYLITGNESGGKLT
jgi:hypothetical protein